jgi:hypothetical protein
MIANPGAEALLGRPVTPGLTLRQLGQPGLTVRTEAFLNGTNSEDAFDETINGRQSGEAWHTSNVDGRRGHHARGRDRAGAGTARAGLGEMARQVAHEIKNPLTPSALVYNTCGGARRQSASTSGASSSRTWSASSPRSIASTKSPARSVVMG